jgi:hypothetical protein
MLEQIQEFGERDREHGAEAGEVAQTGTQQP